MYSGYSFLGFLSVQSMDSMKVHWISHVIMDQTADKL